MFVFQPRFLELEVWRNAVIIHYIKENFVHIQSAVSVKAQRAQLYIILPSYLLRDCI